MKFFQRLRDLADRIIELDDDLLVANIMRKPEVQEFILDMVKNDQLFNEGESYLSVKLDTIGGEYSDATIDGIFGVFEGKKQRGLPFDRVTLFNEGDFYDSFEIDIGLKTWQFDADYDKDGTDLRKRWGDEIVGLNQENLQRLINELREKIIEGLRREFGIAA